jgi:hypothetical protein
MSGGPPFRVVARGLRIVAKLFPPLPAPVNLSTKQNVSTGNQVAVNVDCDLNGTLPYVLFHVDNRGSVLEERSASISFWVSENPKLTK